MEVNSSPVLSHFAKKTQVDLEDGLEKTHVGTLIKTDLVLPKVDYQNFRRSEREKCGFALKVLREALESKRIVDSRNRYSPGLRRALDRQFLRRP